MKRLEQAQSEIPHTHGTVNVGLSHLRESLGPDMYNADMNPDFQRGHVWTVPQQEAFMWSMCVNSRALPPIILNEHESTPNSHYRTDLVDGKQRLTAALAWIDGEIEAVEPAAMAGAGRRRFSAIEILDHVSVIRCSFVFSMVRLRRRQVLDYYLRLNSGGCVHTEDELARVRALRDRESNPPTTNGEKT